jgi:orotidine-5'-phosphate decarboxylase
MDRNFIDLLHAQWKKQKFLSVGIDPFIQKLPDHIKSSSSSIGEKMFSFNKAIIDATADIVGVFKPQSAHYEACGAEGIEALQKTVQYIRDQYPEIPMILDAKRGDIGKTNDEYARFAFDYVGVDAITLQPYFGGEALEPFLSRKNKGCIILVHTSNPGADTMQDVHIKETGLPYYQHLAKMVAGQWNTHGNCGVVAGATYPEQLKEIRALIGNMPMLIPGIGAQGGDLDASVQNGLTEQRYQRTSLPAEPHCSTCRCIRLLL